MSHLELYFDFLTRNAEFFKPWSPKYENGYFELDYHKERLQKIEMDIKEGAAVKFGVFLKNDISKIIGTVSFMNIIKGPFQSCFLGYRFDEKENNKGYATEAIRESIDYIFYAEKLHRIEANIIPRNKPSIRVVEKLGFVNEGLSKKYLQINGKWEDHIHYVLLND
jgi:ribosomal-protein-alanine N-acetyltransferase